MIEDKYRSEAVIDLMENLISFIDYFLIRILFGLSLESGTTYFINSHSFDQEKLFHYPIYMLIKSY